ncbi:MAG: chromate transporter [Stellaceae bacterium]
MAIAVEDSSEIARPATLGALFSEFLKISLLGFGGGIALAHRAAVERRRWLSEGEFADALTLCQFMPGPNVVGIAVCVGAKTRGALGALTAFIGFAVIPGAIGFGLALLYLGQTSIPLVQNILRGISAAAAGLMLATGLRLLKPHIRDPRVVAFAGLAFAGLAIMRFPLLLVLAVLAPLSVAGAIFPRRRVR